MPESDCLQAVRVAYDPDAMARRVSSPRLIGREEELARLRAAVADAEAGRSRFVLVGGDAGIGKSRLVTELVRSLESDVQSMIGRCLAIADGGLPYAPLAEGLRRLSLELDPLTLDRVLGPARSELARLVPDLAATTPSTASSPERPTDRAGQARLFELLLGFLGRLGVERPIVLIVEDVHWAEDATRDLLTYLVANLRGERVAVVATLRTDEAGADPRFERWLVDLMRGQASERIELGPLSPEEVADQLRAILGSPPSAAMTAGIAARSGGNALFVEELLTAGMDAERSGRPEGVGDRGSVDGRRSGTGQSTVDRAATAPLPKTLREMLAVRIRGLSPDTATVIRVLAVAGRAVDDRLLVAATGLPAAAVDVALHDAIARHLVDLDTRAPLVDLHHVLLREAIVAELLGGERRSLHAALAAALSANPDLADPSPAGAAGEVANHWAAADRPVEAFRAALAAADEAMTVHAYADAARHRRRALDLLARLPPDVRAQAPDEVALLLDAEEAANLASDFASAADFIERGIALVDPVADPGRAGILESRLGYHRWLAGRSDEALAHHRRAVELVPPQPPSLARARVVRGLGGALMGLGRYRESAAICDEAIAAAQAADAPVEEGRGLDMLGMDRFGIGDIDGGIAALEAACRIARRHDPGEGLIVGLQNLAYHLGLADRPDDALAAALEGITATRREGLDRRYGLTLRAAAADVLLRLGRWDEADSLIAEGRALDPDGEGPLYLVIVRLRLATVRGWFDEARDALAIGNRMAAADVDFDLVAYLRIAEAELACWVGEPGRAAVAVEAGLLALEGSDDVFLTGPLLALGARAAADRAETARAWRYAGAEAEAREAATRYAARLDELVAVPDGRSAATRGLGATTAWARAERLRADAASEDGAWAELADAWQDLDMPAQAAYARWRRAEALLADGGRSARATAAVDLAAAAAEAARLGNGPLGAAIAGLARRARIDLAAVVPPASSLAPSAADDQARARPGDGLVAGSRDGHEKLRDIGLSGREIDVLELIGSGRTNAEIADALGISAKTAGAHARRVLVRLGVSSRVEAGAVAARLGIVDASPGRAATAETGLTAARTFMFTDIVRSTALIDVIGDAAWSTLRAWHDATLRRLFEAHGGVEVDHAGDGFFVAFPSPGPAVRCAVAIQRTLAEHRNAAGFAPEVRIGVHHGEARSTSTGWAGREVHVAARLMARAGAGEIVASAVTLAAARMRPEHAESVSLPGISQEVAVALVPWR